MRQVVVVVAACMTAAGNTAAAFSVTPQDATAAMEAFNRRFYDAGKASFRGDSAGKGGACFWVSAHLWQLVMDAYERTGEARYAEQAKAIHAAFVKDHGHEWKSNRWNDDIMWWVLANLRARQLFGDAVFLNDAKANFDWIWTTQRDDKLGGGVYEHNNEHGEKNSCINFPTAIAAVRLADLLKDQSYLNRAIEVFTWGRNTLTDKKGQVWDRIFIDGRLDRGSSHYNQGTFIGAASLLYLRTGRRQYLDDAIAAAEWTRKNLCNDGILRFEEHKDLQGGKLILIHNMRILIADCKQEQFRPWLLQNAQAAWCNRSEDNLTWGDWTRKPTGVWSAWSAAPAVGLLQFLAMPSVPGGRKPAPGGLR
jgi:predicted alpha-1,6-mannanase (GH76 family)